MMALLRLFGSFCRLGWYVHAAPADEQTFRDAKAARCAEALGRRSARR